MRPGRAASISFSVSETHAVRVWTFAIATAGPYFAIPLNSFHWF